MVGGLKGVSTSFSSSPLLIPSHVSVPVIPSPLHFLPAKTSMVATMLTAVLTPRLPAAALVCGSVPF